MFPSHWDLVEDLHIELITPESQYFHDPLPPDTFVEFSVENVNLDEQISAWFEPPHFAFDPDPQVPTKTFPPEHLTDSPLDPALSERSLTSF